MNKQQIKSYIIRNLLERNYKVFTSITDDCFVLSRDGIAGTVCIIQTTYASKHRLVLDLRDTKDRTKLVFTGYTYIIGFDVDTKSIWLIPVDDIADNRTLNLSDKKNCYLLLQKQLDNNEPLITTKQFKEAVAQMLASVRKKESDVETEQTQKDKIDNIFDSSP